MEDTRSLLDLFNRRETSQGSLDQDAQVQGRQEYYG